MKYWVYKDAKILGPFDKDAFVGIPEVDSYTLVSAGETAASVEGGWIPAGEVADLAGLALEGGRRWSVKEPLSAYGLLDTSALGSEVLFDEGFSGAAEALFQDADLKRNFTALLVPGPAGSDAELRRAEDRIASLSSQLEALQQRIRKLESARAAPEPVVVAAPAIVPAPAVVPPSVEETVSVQVIEDAIVAPEARQPSAPVPPAPPSFAVSPPEPPPSPPAPPTFVEELREVPQPPAPPVLLPEPAEPPRKASFPEPTRFKIVPAVGSFRVVGKDPPLPRAPEPGVPPPAAVPMPEPVLLKPLQPLTESASTPIQTPRPIAVEPAPVIEPPTIVPLPAPPPLTAPPAAAPPATMDFAWAAPVSIPPAPAPLQTEDVLARLAKPAPTSQTEPPRPPSRSHKSFLLVGAVLVVLLGIAGVLLLRHPKDLRQMIALDDDRERLGSQPVEAPSGTPQIPPPAPVEVLESAPAVPAAAPEPVAAPAVVQPADQNELNGALSLVKDFPLDGGRGTVSRWLQYSYGASQDAGQEVWNASSTGEGSYLVEYRFVPAASGGSGVHYLFAADMSMGLVFGKNLEAQRMLAGGAPRLEARTSEIKAKYRAPVRRSKSAAKAKPAVKPAPAAAPPKEIPLMPLPDDKELLPPVEDDGAFGSETVNTGL